MKKVIVWSVLVLINGFAVFVLSLPRIKWLADLVFKNENIDLAILLHDAAPWAEVLIWLEAFAGAWYIGRRISGDDDYYPNPWKL